MSDLHDADVLQWSEQQARLVRDVAAGKLGNPRKSRGGSLKRPDWANIIEEIESVGQSQVGAVESWWFQAFLHDLKAEAWPLARDVPHRQGEARGFRAQARRKYRPSMSGEPVGSTQQKIDLDGLYADALAALPESMDGQPPLAGAAGLPRDARRPARGRSLSIDAAGPVEAVPGALPSQPGAAGRHAPGPPP